MKKGLPETPVRLSCRNRERCQRTQVFQVRRVPAAFDQAARRLRTEDRTSSARIAAMSRPIDEPIEISSSCTRAMQRE